MKTVLVVDDSSFIRLRIKEILQPLGIKVIERDSGESLIQLLNDIKIRVDLILLDIFMPGMDGLDTVFTIKKKEQFRYIPIIIMTGYAKSDIVVKAIKLGIQDFLVKPIDENKLKEKITKILALNTPSNGFIKLTSEKYIDIEMKRASRGKSSLTVIAITLKKINETNIDSQILSSLINGLTEEISSSLNTKMRETDIVLSYGQDKLIVVLPLTAIEGLPIVQAKIEKICQGLCGDEYSYLLNSVIYNGNEDKPYNLLQRLIDN